MLAIFNYTLSASETLVVYHEIPLFMFNMELKKFGSWFEVRAGFVSIAQRVENPVI